MGYAVKTRSLKYLKDNNDTFMDMNVLDCKDWKSNITVRMQKLLDDTIGIQEFYIKVAKTNKKFPTKDIHKADYAKDIKGFYWPIEALDLDSIQEYDDF